MKACAFYPRYLVYFFSFLLLFAIHSQGCDGNEEVSANEQSQSLALIVSSFQTYSTYAALAFHDENLPPQTNFAEGAYSCPSGGTMSGTTGNGVLNACAFSTFSSTGTITGSNNNLNTTIQATVTSSYEDASQFNETSLVEVTSDQTQDSAANVNFTFTGHFDSEVTIHITSTGASGRTTQNQMLISGTLNVFQGDVSIGTCTLNELDVLTATCANYASACGYDTTSCPN